MLHSLCVLCPSLTFNIIKEESGIPRILYFKDQIRIQTDANKFVSCQNVNMINDGKNSNEILNSPGPVAGLLLRVGEAAPPNFLCI